MQTLISYLGSSDLKARLLVEIGAHEAADAIMKGSYGGCVGGQWKGCAIGCSLRSLNKIAGATTRETMDVRTGEHGRFPKELGIPIGLAYAEDNIFEHLPTELSKTWPRRFAEAVPVGADLSQVTPRLMLWVLVSEQYGVIHATDDAHVKQVVQHVADLFTRELAGEQVTEAEWEQARAEAAEAAWAARAARAAWAAEAAEAARAARAAWAAEAAEAAWAARAAWAAWAAEAAWAAYYPALSEHLLTLLREAPIMVTA